MYKVKKSDSGMLKNWIEKQMPDLPLTVIYEAGNPVSNAFNHGDQITVVIGRPYEVKPLYRDCFKYYHRKIDIEEFLIEGWYVIDRKGKTIEVFEPKKN